MTMPTNTTKANLTRWLKLFEKDETLRPDNLMSPFVECGDWYLKVPEGRIPQSTAEALIRDSAIRWFNTKHEGLTIGDGHWDENYRGSGGFFSGFSVQVIGPVMPENYSSGECLIDALYEAVVAVMEEDKRQTREHRKFNSLLGRTKRKIGSLLAKRSKADRFDDLDDVPGPP